MNSNNEGNDYKEGNEIPSSSPSVNMNTLFNITDEKPKNKLMNHLFNINPNGTTVRNSSGINKANVKKSNKRIQALEEKTPRKYSFDPAELTESDIDIEGELSSVYYTANNARKRASSKKKKRNTHKHGSHKPKSISDRLLKDNMVHKFPKQINNNELLAESERESDFEFEDYSKSGMNNSLNSSMKVQWDPTELSESDLEPEFHANVKSNSKNTVNTRQGKKKTISSRLMRDQGLNLNHVRSFPQKKKSAAAAVNMTMSLKNKNSNWNLADFSESDRESDFEFESLAVHTSKNFLQKRL